MKPVIVIALPYGEPDREKRTPLEYVGYKHYLREAAHAISDLGDKVVCVANVSVESSTVQPVLRQLLQKLTEHLPYMFEERESTTTPGGIYRGYKMIWHHWDTITRNSYATYIPGDPRDCDILVLSDIAREYKCRKLTPKLIKKVEKTAYNHGRSIEVLGLHRPDINLKSNKLIQWTETQALLYVPGLLKKRL